MDIHQMLALARPYRPHQPWEDYLYLAFGAFILFGLILTVMSWVQDSRRKAKAEKHAALNRVRAKQRKR